MCDCAGKEEDWLGARNFCRQRCMDSVSVETSPENEWVKQRIVEGKVSVSEFVDSRSEEFVLDRDWNNKLSPSDFEKLCICVRFLLRIIAANDGTQISTDSNLFSLSSSFLAHSA